MAEQPQLRSEIVFLVPVLDDWQAVGQLVAELDRVLQEGPATASVLIVDDGSRARPGTDFLTSPLQRIKEVRVLGLRANVGHQRAIAIGLAYLYERALCQAVVVMDADGEDRPEDVPRLMRRLRERQDREIIFAERTRRPGSLWFRLLYHVYRAVHRLATGISVRVGNFSAVPSSLLANLVGVPGLWCHYAAAVFHARIPHDTVPTTRGRRLAGESKMSFVGLVAHGLNAISVFGDIIGTRIFILGSALFLAAATLLCGTFWLQWQAGSGPTYWALAAILGTVILLLLTLAIGSGFLFILYSRNSLAFLPLRDYQYFIGGVSTVYPDVR